MGMLFKLMPKMKKWTHPDYRKDLCGAIQDPVLRNWFTNYGYSHMPFHLFAGFWHFWVNDYWYPSGGLQSLMNTLVKKFEENGGEARFKSPVKKIIVENKKATGIITEKGEKIEAENIVYTGDYKKLVSDIVGDEHFKPAFVDKIKRAKVIESFVAVYLGLDIPVEKLRRIMKAHHVVRFQNFDFAIPDKNSPADAHTKTSIMLSSPSFADPTLAPEGKSSLVIQCITTAEWQNYWNNGGLGTKRAAEYKQLKNTVGKQLVKIAESVIPDLSKKIEFMDISTPLTLNRYTWNTDGASAGWSHDQSKGAIVGRYGLFQMRSPVKGLYTAGHYTFWPGGIPSVISSGKFAANFILKKSPFAQFDKLMRMLGR
jgi:prolycopene isomerase